MTITLINVIKQTRKNTYLWIICLQKLQNVHKIKLALLHLKKGLFVTRKRPQCVKQADHRHLSKPSLYCIQTKSPNVQCHKDLKIQWDATSLNVPEQSNKLFKRTCWNGETMLIHERFCPTCSESVKANDIIFCMVNS